MANNKIKHINYEDLCSQYFNVGDELYFHNKAFFFSNQSMIIYGFNFKVVPKIIIFSMPNIDTPIANVNINYFFENIGIEFKHTNITRENKKRMHIWKTMN